MSTEATGSRRAFVVIAGLLLAACLGRLAAAGVFDFRLEKAAVDLRGALATLPQEFGSYRFAEEVSLHESIVRKLGASEQITWVYVDESVARREVGSAIRLHAAYYTGHEETLRVKHVPEICYVNFGFEGEDTHRGTVRVADEEVPLSVFRFRPENSEDNFGVAYCFVANGELCGSPEAALTACHDIHAESAYFLKIELLMGIMEGDGIGDEQFRPLPASQQEILRSSQRFLEALLPELRKLLPAVAEQE